MNLEYLKYSSQRALLKKYWRGALFLFLFFPMHGRLPRTQDTPAGSKRLKDALRKLELEVHACYVASRLTLRDPVGCSCQAPLSMGLSRRECWSGLPCPPPGGLPEPGIGPRSLTSPALAGGFLTTSTTWKELDFF